jgi:hypothetical protein
MFTTTAPGIKLNNYYAEIKSINSGGSPLRINSGNSNGSLSTPPDKELNVGSLLKELRSSGIYFELSVGPERVHYEFNALESIRYHLNNT